MEVTFTLWSFSITEAEMKFFKPAFDRIVELFNSTSRTLELLKTNTFEEFCAQMR